MEIAGLPRPSVVKAIVGAWAAFITALCLALPQPPRLSHVLLGAGIGALLILVGFFLASRLRPIAVRQPLERARQAACALLLGAVLGAVLLWSLSFLVRFEPALRARFAGRLADPVWRPWALAFESSILEEITFRLFGLTVLTWLAARLLWGAGAPFAIGLAGSALLFGLAHLPAWASATAGHGTLLLPAVVLLLNGVGGLLFGWLFWRWGLPYAILCHFAGDVVIQALGPRLLA